MKSGMRFKAIVRGVQIYEAEKNGDQTTNVPVTQNDRAMCFDYEAIMNNYGIDINSYVLEDLPED